MPKNKDLKLLMDLAKINALITRVFGVQGLSLSDFMVLSYLDEAPDGKLRRTDLAEKLGLTASGVTRMLLPMEKIGLIKRAEEKNDARVSYVVIASGGRRILEEASERAELLSNEIISNNSNLLKEIKLHK